MKNLSMLLVLLTVSTPSFAQVNKAPVSALAESGSGNGNLNRDVLDYDTKLDEATVELKSLEESFAKLIKNLRALSNAKVPEFSTAGDDFWHNLAPKDQEKIVALDQKLTGAVEAQIKQLAVIKEQVLAEQATIDALAKEIPRYEERGMGKDFRREIKDKRNSLKYDLNNKLAQLFVALEKPITDTREVYESSYYWRVYRSAAYFDMKECASGLCVDIMTNKFNAFKSLIDDVAEIKINMLGISRKLGFIAHENWDLSPILLNGYGGVSKSMKKLVKESSYAALKEINEAAVRSINN